MARTITSRLSDDTYEAVKHYADVDQQSMNSWIESLLDVEDMRRCCVSTTGGWRRVEQRPAAPFWRIRFRPVVGLRLSLRIQDLGKITAQPLNGHHGLCPVPLGSHLI